MITLCEECEYTHMIADLIETLGGLEKFTLKIWISNSEIPLTLNEVCDYHFMQEGIRIRNSWQVGYLFYDMITYVVIEIED